jgi:MSHA biogenesis protein MshI
VLPRPAVPDAELVEAARWQLQGALDYPPEEAVLDVLRLGENEPAARQQLAVFAVRRAELAQWLAPLTARKVTLEAVEVADCAQRNLAALHGAHGQAVAMLGYREDSVVFSVTRGSEVLVSRSFDATSLRATASAAAAETDVGAFAERVGLQLQRMLDTLERRSASMAPSQIVVIKHPTQAALLAQCAELTGLRVMPLDLTGLPGLAVALAAHPAPLGELQGDFIHLWAAALRPQPVEALA